jgi:hypothetical protein
MNFTAKSNLLFIIIKIRVSYREFILGDRNKRVGSTGFKEVMFIKIEGRDNNNNKLRVLKLYKKIRDFIY